MITFGEQVCFRPLKSYTVGQGDLQPKMKLGRYVGARGRNGDVLVMTPEGVWKGGSVKRTPLEQRWSREDFDKLKGAWNLRPKTAENIDSLPVQIGLPPAEGKLTPDAAPREPGGARNLYVTTKDVEGHRAVGCPGCIAIQTGMPARRNSGRETSSREGSEEKQRGCGTRGRTSNRLRRCARCISGNARARCSGNSCSRASWTFSPAGSGQQENADRRGRPIRSIKESKARDT